MIKGWCPGAYRPMMSGDGLVVRIRPMGGRVTAAQARGLADLSERFGSGGVELTSRGNLQLRAISPCAHPEVITALAGLELLDADPAVEGRRNIALNPFENRDYLAARALARGLVADDFAGLPSKFGFVVDTGPRRLLADISGDIRLERAVSGGVMLRADGQDTGRLVAKDGVAEALDLARWFLQAGGVGADGRGRMRHMDALGGEAWPVDVGAAPQVGTAGYGAAFGVFSARALRHLAAHSAVLHITPFRMIHVPDQPLRPHNDLITDPDHPLLRMRACVGAPHCASAQISTRDAAQQIALHIPKDFGVVHISGCAKGCAHPQKAPVTIVGANGAFALVRNGAAWETPYITCETIAETTHQLKV